MLSAARTSSVIWKQSFRPVLALPPSFSHAAARMQTSHAKSASTDPGMIAIAVSAAAEAVATLAECQLQI